MMRISTRNSKLSGKILCSRIFYLVSKQEGKASAYSNLSKEEKIAKAKQLQEQIRKKRAEEAKKLAEESERNRIAGTKAMAEVKRKLDE